MSFWEFSFKWVGLQVIKVLGRIPEMKITEIISDSTFQNWFKHFVSDDLCNAIISTAISSHKNRRKINFFQTETILWNGNESNDVTCPESIIKLQNVELIHYKHFKYLGLRITYNKCRIMNDEIEPRLYCATGSFLQYFKVPQNQNMMCRIVLLHLSNVWILQCDVQDSHAYRKIGQKDWAGHRAHRSDLWFRTNALVSLSGF